MTGTTFTKVWYSPKLSGWKRWLRFFAWWDKGTLVVNEDSLEFHGRKEKIRITDIKKISYGKAFSNRWNYWVKIEYGDGRQAFFIDGSWLGWGSVFGGNKRIWQAVIQLTGPELVTSGGPSLKRGILGVTATVFLVLFLVFILIILEPFFDSDSEVDLARRPFSPARVTLWENRPSRTVSDFNRDGNLDIASLDTENAVVLVWMGRGDGSFSPPISLSPGEDPVDIAVADLNQDGHPDIVVANRGSNDLSVFFGDGMGGFSTGARFAVDTAPAVVQAADVNGDGTPELITLHPGLTNVLFLNDDGSLRERESAVIGVVGENIVLIEFGLPELQGIPRKLFVRNREEIRGAFSRGKFVIVTAHDPVGVYPVDFNLDGRVDILTVNQGSRDISWQLARQRVGWPAYYDLQAAPLNRDPRFFVVNDFNLDGYADVAVLTGVTEEPGYHLELFRWQPGEASQKRLEDYRQGELVPAGHYRGEGTPLALVSGDFNDDGLMDLAIPVRETSEVTVMFGDTGMRFVAASSPDEHLWTGLAGGREEDPDPPPESPDPEGPSLLWLACRTGRSGLAEGLIGSGADINEPDRDGVTPLMAAAAGGERSLVELLLSEGASVNGRDRFRWTVTHYAAYSGSPEVLRLLLENGAPVDSRAHRRITPLAVAIANQNLDAAETLLAAGSDANAYTHLQPGRGWPQYLVGIVHYRSRSKPMMDWAVSTSNPRLVSLLVEYGADLGYLDRVNASPLLKAIHRRDIAMVRVLLEEGADPNQRWDLGDLIIGEIPLNIAAGSEPARGWEPARAVALLLEHGADVNQEDRHGNTADHYARRANNEEALRLLENAGALDPDI